MHPLVIDTSVALAWVLDDETSPVSTSALSSALAGQGHVPALFYFEIVNALTMAKRRARIADDILADCLESILTLPLTVQPIDFRKLAALSEMHKLTAYDAAYLQLAQTLNAPLATHDKELARAARKAGLKVIS